MSEPEINPCSFKKCCKNCQMVELDDRPQMCLSLSCEFYVPCKGCGLNKYCGDNGLCIVCSNSKPKVTLAQKRKEFEESRKIHEGTLPPAVPMPEASIPGPLDEPIEDTPDLRNYSLVPPGTPPPELKENETEYYIKRWSEYSGYYRNPAAFFVVHAMILEEIHCSDLISRSLYFRGERQADYLKTRELSYRMLATLREQLPEKESDERSDYEKSLSVIHQEYFKEKAKRYVGGVSRMFSPSALALAPKLIHKLDPVQILERMGFNLIDEDEFLRKYEQIPDLEKLPPSAENMDIIMEFFGYRLKERYAMKYNVLETEDYEPEADVTEG